MKRSDMDGQPANAGAIDGLAKELVRKESRYLGMADFVPFDARMEVVVPWRNELFHILPGSLERSVAVTNRLAFESGIIDPLVEPHLGYGLSDILDLALARMDHVWQRLHSIWSPPVDASSDAPRLSPGELRASGELCSWDDIVALCPRPTHARSALEAHTVDARVIMASPDDPVSTFGPCLAVRRGSRIHALPSGFLPEALLSASERVREIASRHTPAASDPLMLGAWKRLAHLLDGSGFHIRGPVRAGQSTLVHSVVTFSERKLLVLDFAAGLGAESVRRQIERGASSLENFRPGGAYRDTQGTVFSIDPGAEVVRIQVIAGPQVGLYMGQSYPILTIDDLTWIIQTSHKTPEDVWYFFRDLELRPSIDSMFAWDMIDKWEVWRVNRAFYTGGSTVSFMAFAPHESVAEWSEGANRAGLERGLLAAGLAPTRDWPIAVVNDDGTADLGDMASGIAIGMIYEPISLVVYRTDPMADDAEVSDAIWGIADGVLWKMRRITTVLLEVMRESGLSSITLRFAHDSSEGRSLEVGPAANGDVTMLWRSGLTQLLHEDPSVVEGLCGQAVAGTLADPQRSKFLDAWASTPPSVRLDAFVSRAANVTLPRPMRPVEATKREWERRLGRHLRDAKWVPGLYHGSQATAVESTGVFPWLLSELHREVAPFSPLGVLRQALTQLECANRERLILDQRIAWQRGFPVHDAIDTAQRAERIIALTRAISLVVEEVLLAPPNGSRKLHDDDWLTVISIADLCVQSCMRSDAIHQRLTNVGLELTDMFEVRTSRSEVDTDIDLPAYQDARREATLPNPIPIGQTSSNAGHDESASQDEQQLLIDAFPALRPINDALLSSLGFDLNALIGVLNVVVQWPTDDVIVAVDPAALVARAVRDVLDSDESRLSAAVGWLTLSQSRLAPGPIRHWETERRANRIMNRPLVDFAGKIWLLPWTTEVALKVLANYLHDGRLPWPNTVLPKAVLGALGHYRQARNRELEVMCAKALRDAGYISIPQIKPNKSAQYGILQLSGEIDVLCIDQLRSRVWVIEAKDPYTPFSSFQVRRLFDDFYGDGNYIDKLMKKVADVKSSLGSVLAKQELGATKGWEVLPLMVTRHEEPAAFARTPRIPFATVDGVTDFVENYV